MRYKKKVIGFLFFVSINISFLFIVKDGFPFKAGCCGKCDCEGDDPKTTCTLCTADPATTKSEDSSCEKLTDTELTTEQTAHVTACCDASNKYATMRKSIYEDLKYCKECNPSGCVSFDTAVANGGHGILSATAALAAAAVMIDLRKKVIPSSGPSSFIDKDGKFVTRGATEGNTAPPTAALFPNARPQDSDATAKSATGGTALSGSGAGSSGLGALNGGGADTPSMAAASANKGAAGSGHAGATAGAVTDAVYGAGGKAGSANNGNGSYGSGGRPESDLSGGAADAPQSVTTFQKGSDTTTASVFLSDDPEDYFTRMNLTDSLFKVIHDRYLAESLNWLRGKAPAKPAVPAVLTPAAVPSPPLSKP